MAADRVELRPLNTRTDDVFDDDEGFPNGVRGFKRRLRAVLESPSSSEAAFIVHVLTTTLIVASALVTVLETLPALHRTSSRVWFGIETSFVALFTIEYLARCAAWSTSSAEFLSFALSFFGIVDFLAIAPYYLEIALQADTTVFFRFSILRVFRLLRVFRSFRHSHALLLTIEVMFISFQRSKDALLALSFFVMMALIVFSTLLYFAERGSWDPVLETFVNEDGDVSQFASIPACSWFVITTISTVGYGDMTPRSLLGRLITLPLLVFGLLLIALPSFVLGREFSIVWEEMSGTVGNGSASDERQPHTPSVASPITRRGFGRASSSMTQMETTMQLAQLREIVEAQGVLLRRVLAEREPRQ